MTCWFSVEWQVGIVLWYVGKVPEIMVMYREDVYKRCKMMYVTWCLQLMRNGAKICLQSDVKWCNRMFTDRRISTSIHVH